MKREWVQALVVILFSVFWFFAGMGMAQVEVPEQWTFIPDGEIIIYSERSLESTKLGVVGNRQAFGVTGAYVQAEGLIWIETLEGYYAPVARFANCDTVSFGSYQPEFMEPVSVQVED